MHTEPTRQGRASLRDILLALRPTQWTKNLVVLAAYVFAFWDRSRSQALGLPELGRVVIAMALFCVVSSGIYVLNDILDLEADRKHPLKRRRPLAAGRLSLPGAVATALLLLAGGSVGSFLLSRPFAVVVGGYVLIQIVYSAGLKHVALVDILVIAGGFVLRAIAGALVVEVRISPWLLLCTFLLALFLALCKRRHEKLLVNAGADQLRPSLGQYDQRLLDQLISISGGATIVSYAIYTLSPQTVEKFGTVGLGFTIPFVVFGVFRYLDLAYRHAKGDQPDRILLTDIPTLANVFLYGVSVIVVFLLRG